MLPALVSLKSLIRNKSYHIDYPIFRLHYQATVCLLLGFCLMITAKVLFGDTIDCRSRMVPHDQFYDNICYSQGTFTKAHDRNNTMEQYFQPGLTVSMRDSDFSSGRKYWHNYYQYMPLVLFIQAVCFYLPHYIWKSWENGLISTICKQLYDNRFSPNEYLETNYNLVHYLQNCFTINKTLVYKYYFCQNLLLLNLACQVIALDALFNNQFISYGYSVVYYNFVDSNYYGMQGSNGRIEEVNNPMDIVFPKMSACRLDQQSSAGNTLDKLFFLCVLPLNILHDKFYLLLWFWFLILGILTVSHTILDLLYITMPWLRKYMFIKRFGHCLWEDNQHTSSLSKVFILDLIGCNSDKYAFGALMKKLYKEDAIEDWTATPTDQSFV